MAMDLLLCDICKSLFSITTISTQILANIPKARGNLNKRFRFQLLKQSMPHNKKGKFKETFLSMILFEFSFFSLDILPFIHSNSEGLSFQEIVFIPVVKISFHSFS